MHVGWLVETLDPGTDELPFVCQLFEKSGDTYFGCAEVVRDPAGQRNAERTYRLESQRTPHLLFVRREGVFPIWQRVRQHAFAQLVDTVEVLAAGDHELPRGEQVLQRPLLGLPLPPTSCLPACTRELRGAHGTFCTNVLYHVLDLLVMGTHPGSGLLPSLYHEPAVQAVVLDRDEARRVRPVLEQRPLSQKLVQPPRLVVTQPAPQHQVRAARDNGDGVDLQHPHLTDDSPNVLLRGTLRHSSQPLRHEQQLPRLLYRKLYGSHLQSTIENRLVIRQKSERNEGRIGQSSAIRLWLQPERRRLRRAEVLTSEGLKGLSVLKAGTAGVLARQQTAAHQELVRLAGGLAALGDGRDDQVSPQPGVAGDEDIGHFGAETVLRVDRAALGVAEVQVLEEAVAHGTREANGEQHEVGLYLEVRALFGDGSAVRSTLGLDGVHRFDVAACTRKALYGDVEAALATLLVGRVGVQDEGPVRPGEVVGGLGRAGAVGQYLYRGAALAVGVAEAIRARVAAAQDYDVLAGGGDRDLRIGREACRPPVLLHQVVHSEVDAAELAARHVEVTSLQGADGEDDGVELALEVLRGRVLADVGAGAELDPFLLHNGDAAVEDPLFDLVVGDTVSEEAAESIIFLEHDSRMSGPVELLRRGEPCGPATHDGDLPACTLLRRRRPGDDPSFLEGPIDDGELYLFYGDGLVVDGEDARSLARGRAEHPRELREIVGLVQAIYGLLPVLAINEVVPVGDQVPQRAARVAERHAAIHATRGLAFKLLVGHRLVDVAVVLDAFLDGTFWGRLASYLEEALRVPH